MKLRIAQFVSFILTALFTLLVIAQLVFFVIRTTNLLRYPFPLDYGEGPLQAQIDTLLNGTPIWALYADPGMPPYLVVNYPPVYHSIVTPLALLLTALIGDTSHAALLAGRLVSLIAGLGCVMALWALAARGQVPESASRIAVFSPHYPRLLVCLALLGIPIVREWSSVMRVDLLGVCLGLHGLVVLQRRTDRWGLFWAAVLLSLALLTKPSLLAAPLAGILWLGFRDWRRAGILAGLCAAIGMGSVGLLQIASGSWFWLHVVQANANPWDFDLAHGFWRDQFALMLPLLMAAGIGIVSALRLQNSTHSRFSEYLLPLYYTLFGLITAFGVGKLGAYTNYFLEAYIGLFWLAATGVNRVQTGTEPQLPITNDQLATTSKRIQTPATNYQLPVILLLVALSLSRYYPLWSEEYLLPAGIIEGRNPIRLSFGSNGIWQDLQREQLILAARGRINQALLEPVRSAGTPIFTDIPAVAAQAGVLSRIQSFEHRMLIDPGLWDEHTLLRDLANGQVPLVVLDYLGNWMTNDQIAIITKRYAQDASIGLYSIYQPIEPGPRTAIDLQFPNRLHAVGFQQTTALAASTYTPGEIPVVTLEWRVENPEQGWKTELPDVVLQLLDREGRPLLETTRPLVYAALSPDRWGEGTVQHMQPLPLPAELPAGSYQIAMTLRVEGQDLAPAQQLSTLQVAEGGGRMLGEQGYFVPAPLLAEWERLGGYAGPGDPVSPTVPFASGLQQCYATACLRMNGGMILRLPIGELAWMGEAGLPRIAGSPPEGQLSPEFQQFYTQHGGAAQFGPAIGYEMKRFDKIVQYTRYARLERPLDGSPGITLGRVGEDVLRLPAGTPYRWP